MVAFLKWLLLAPVAILVILLAVSNRHDVTVVFDPFSGDTPGLALTAPMFVVIFASVILGVLLGGFATWLKQGRYRRAARTARAEAARNRVDAERLRAQVASLPALPTADRRAA